MTPGNKKGRVIGTLAATILFSFAALTGCASSNNSAAGDQAEAGGASSKKQELVVTSFGGTYDEAFAKYVIEPFEAENPGVKVTLAPYTGVAKLSQGGGDAIDIVQLDDFDIIDAGQAGLLSELKQDEFSHWGDLYPQAILNGEGGTTYGVVNVFGAWGIAYNPEKMEKPESWNDLWAPELKGKVALMSQWIPDILLTAEAVGASTDGDMKPVWDAFRKLTPSVAQYYSSFSAPESLFGTGQIHAAAWFDGRALAMKESGSSVDFVLPKEGGVLIRSGLGVMKSSKNQELARKLIDFTLTPQAQQGFAKELFYGPTNKTVELDADLQSKVVYGEETLSKLIAPDWTKLLPMREEWLTQWTEATAQ
ncbi:ABC transporter substrate-binding protein [Paenibacillus thermotolerans]|uniref:ABC transporter substrate-binding protein n=1 Tax=Paenibacillus thermotolerans TaxID=3027807 RepID=UPI002367D645|nr:MULTISPECIES: extracellular solute-binding protein [unclassified Paenibacillus]